MQTLLPTLRVLAEPTRYRLAALATRGTFCVADFTEILDQSQPRLSRHLRLLCEAKVLARTREGALVWFGLAETEEAALVRELLARSPQDDPTLAADHRTSTRLLAERAHAASEQFRRHGADWDEMRALGLPAEAVEKALLDLVAEPALGRILDIGTGTGRALELLGPRASAAIGIDTSHAMLSLARHRLARPELAHCQVRRGDMYRLPLPDQSFDLALLQMVLHYAEDPSAVIAEAARVLRFGARLVVVELAAHPRSELAQKLAHRWHGFTVPSLRDFLTRAGLSPSRPVTVEGPMPVLLISAARLRDAILAPPTVAF